MPLFPMAVERPSTPDLSQPGVLSSQPASAVIQLPTEYIGFCLLYRNAYRQYALRRLQDVATAYSCVERALGELLTIWPAVLSSPRPSAIAWRVLRTWVNAAVDCHQYPSLPGALSPARADVLLLREKLNFPIAKVAAVMGLDEGTVSVHLRCTARAAQGCSKVNAGKIEP